MFFCLPEWFVFQLYFPQINQLIPLINPDNHKGVQVIALLKIKYNPTKIKGMLKICPILISNEFSNAS